MNNNSTFSFSSEVSYLCGRDPSLRPGERPRPLNLLSQFGEAKKEAEDVVKVYLRIKPSDELEDTRKLFTEIDDRKLFVEHPRDSTSSYKSDHHARRYSEQFIFSKILSSGVDQSQVFRECALQPLKNFIKGDNCLVFAYGTTNAGKTFTIRGDARNPGIIPRALDYLFSSLGDRILDQPNMHLAGGCSLREYSEGLTAVVADYKRIMLETSLLDHYKRYDRKLTSTSSLNSDASSDASLMFQDMEVHTRQDMMSDTHVAGLDEDTKFLVYVSFAEIYNENIYDLLQLPKPRLTCGWRRTPLQLGLDAHGKTYIKDLNHFQVTSGYEAYRIMLFGQHNLRIAGTELNSVSSRSHCIFNIKLVKCMGSFDDTSISTFSFCDLAGSERAKKTHNFGERMKESQNINTSLMVLGRCLNALRANQQSKDKLQVPFRDSKLTRLFKEPLMRKGCVSIIVNVNLDSYLYDETLNVLKFSAIAREVVLPPRKKKPARMSLFAKHLQKRRQTIRESSTDGSTASLKDSSIANTESLVKLVERLQTELRQERSHSATLAQQLRTKEHESAAKERAFALREDNLRSELVRDFQETLQDIVSRSEASRESLECRMEDMANFRVRLAQKKCASLVDKLKRQLKKRKLQDVEEDMEECSEESALEDRLLDSEARLAASQREVQGLQAERDTLRATVTMQSQQTNTLQERVTRLELQLKMSLPPVVKGDNSAYDELLSSLRQQLQELTLQKVALEKQIKELRDTVESAAEDHEELLEERNKLEKECYSLEKTLAEKEVEAVELNNRIDTYQATFTKQAQKLDLLQKLADDRLQVLEANEKHIHELEVKIKELSESKEKRYSLKDSALHLSRDTDTASLTVQREEELLQQIQRLETSLCKKEDELETVKQTLSTKLFEEENNKVEAIVQTEETVKECSENYKKEVNDRLDVMTQNRDLQEELEQKMQNIEELTERLIAFQGNYNSQSLELRHLESLAHERLEALQQQERCVNELNLRVEEFTSLEEKWKHALQELVDKNTIAEEKLIEAEQRRTVEAEALQKEIKNLLQRVRSLEHSINEKDAELRGLQNDLKKEIASGLKLNKEVALLTEEINKQKQEFNLAVRVKEEVQREKIEHISYENAELRNTLAQLEKEKEKQCQQHESLFKVYEDRLKQKTDEMERYKRDAQHCQEILYKNTPTPNKETQEVIQGLRNELRKKGSQVVDLERKVACMKIQIGNDMHTEISEVELNTSPVRDNLKENRQPSKSTSKKIQVRSTRTTQPKTRSTRGATSTEPKPDSSAVSRTKMKTRKQLFTLNNESFVDVGEDQWEPLHSKAKETKKKPKSPNTILKKSLRAKP